MNKQKKTKDAEVQEGNASAGLPSVQELRQIVVKRKRRRWSAMWFIEPVQIHFTHLFLRLGLNATHVTVLWLIVALVAYAIIAIGTPLAYIGGAILIFAKICMDGSDGEIARYNKRFMTPKEDAVSFINGVYLDKVFHSIESPLLGLGLGIGLFRATGIFWVWPAAVSLAVFRSFYRCDASIRGTLPHRFRPMVQELIDKGEFGDNPLEERRASIAVRVLDRLARLLRNGKTLTLLLFLCGVADLIAESLSISPVAVLYFVLAAGIASPLFIVHSIVRTVMFNDVVLRTVKMCAIPSATKVEAETKDARAADDNAPELRASGASGEPI